jgi:hypothetical protein
MSTFGIIKRVTNAISYEKLSGTFEEILNKHNHNSVKLIDTSIRFDYNRNFPWENIKKPQTNNRQKLSGKHGFKKLSN